MSQPESGWFADPSRRHTYRFWDGTRWTNQVSDGGAAGIDPVDLDEVTAATPPAPGSQAPETQAAPVERPQPAGIEVTQRSGGGFSGMMGVLVGAIIVILVLVLVFNNAGEDDSTTSTDLTVTTEEPSEAPPTSAP